MSGYQRRVSAGGPASYGGLLRPDSGAMRRLPGNEPSYYPATPPMTVGRGRSGRHSPRFSGGLMSPLDYWRPRSPTICNLGPFAGGFPDRLPSSRRPQTPSRIRLDGLSRERREGIADLRDPGRAMPKYREGGDCKTLTPDLAVVRMVDYLTSERGRKAGARAITKARAFINNESPDWAAVPFLIWPTLDTGVFDGRLSPAVHFDWTNAWDEKGEVDTLGQTFAPGAHRDPDGSPIERITILLNQNYFGTRAQSGSPSSRKKSSMSTAEMADLVIAGMLHEMVHAWSFRACGKQSSSSADGRVKHAEGFWKIMYTIADVARDSDSERSKESRVDDIAPPFLETIRRLHKPLSDGSPIPRRVAKDQNEGVRDHTLCHAKCMHVVSSDDADAWYKKISGAAKDATSDMLYTMDSSTGDVKEVARHERGSPSTYIEVLWEKKPFDYKLKALESNFSSMRTRFSGGRRVLTLPRGVDKSTFRVLDFFLKRGADYWPSMAPLPASGSIILSAPFRKPTLGGETDGQDPLWLDVRAFKIGAALEFPELQDLALSRLGVARPSWQMSPIDALAEIYGGSPDMRTPYPASTSKSHVPCAALDTAEPDDRLREWARRLMLGTRPGQTASGYYASNLHTIVRHCGGGGIEGLVTSTQSHQLEQDYRMCVSRLWKNTPESMHPPGGIFTGGGGPIIKEIPVFPVRVPGLDEFGDLRGSLPRRATSPNRWSSSSEDEFRGLPFRSGRRGRSRSRSRSRGWQGPRRRARFDLGDDPDFSDEDLEDDGSFLRKKVDLLETARRLHWTQDEIAREVRMLKREHQWARRGF